MFLRLLGTALRRMTEVPEAERRLDLPDAGGPRRRRVSAPGETDDLIDVLRTARDVDVAAVLKQTTGRAVQSERPVSRGTRSLGRRVGVRRRRSSARGRIHLRTRPGRERSSGSSRRCAASLSPRDAGGEGLLLVDKPRGVTSHDVVDVVRRGARHQEGGACGHARPDGDGAAPDRGRSRHAPAAVPRRALPKTYEGTLRLGVETTTLDADGDVVREPRVDVTERRSAPPCARWWGSRSSGLPPTAR